MKQNKRIIGNILMLLGISIISFFIINTYADTIIGGTNGQIADEKTLVRMGAGLSKGADSSNTIKKDVLSSELNKYSGNGPANVSEKTSDTLEVTFSQTGNKYDVNTSTGPLMDATGATTPYLPTGYTAVPGTDLQTGFVIEDSTGNQFVWVEVPKTAEVYQTAGLDITMFTDTEYEMIENDLHTYTSVYRNWWPQIADEYYSGVENGLTSSQYYAQKKKMLKSIYKNGGFYVGRYETGIDYSESHRIGSGETTQTPIIKQNAYPYNFVTLSQAQTLSSSFATTGYTSSLMFGVQWDLVLKYLENAGISQSELITDSKSWGNYYNSIYHITNTNAKYSTDSEVTWTAAPHNKAGADDIGLTTGANEAFCKQNIYDLAGNMWEITLEIDEASSTPIRIRGGGGSNTGTLDAAMARGGFSGDYGHRKNSFRVALYKDEGEAADEGVAAPYIPEGYDHVYGTTLETGLVIEDGSGNQFVWVEVPQTAETYPTAGLSIKEFTDAEYKKIENDLHTYTSVYRNGTAYKDEYSTEASTGMTENQYNTQKKKMLKSIYKNGGFYVGRYETGIDYSEDYRDESGDATQTPVIKQHAYPYNFVTRKQSQILSSRFGTDGYTSSLIFGVQWDLTLKYLETKGTSQAELLTDSTNWGNYYNSTYTIANTGPKWSGDSGQSWEPDEYEKPSTGDSVLLSTGASETFSKQNISDLAGNMNEWTLENSIGASWANSWRGGDFYDHGGDAPVNQRGSNYDTLSYQHWGFRVALYKDEGTGTEVETAQPYIPEGYTRVAGTDLGTGFTIEDGSGNQFVWVEVPRTTAVYQTAGLNIENFSEGEFEKIENDLKTYTSSYYQGGWHVENTDTFTATEESAIREYNLEEKRMLKSIYQNGGFYIGRYETGIEDSYRTAKGDATETPVIKANAYPYNHVIGSQAQTLSRSFSTEGYTSSLIFGLQWDLTLKYLETKGTAKEEMTTDSTEWGNYINNTFTITNKNAKYSLDDGVTWQSATSYSKTSETSALLTTGASNEFSKQNIYDLAGNEWEFTYEDCEDSNALGALHVRRSAYFYNYGFGNPAWYRYVRSHNIAGVGCSFRVALYKDEGTGSEVEPYIPQGYTHVAGTDMDTGFVVEDSLGNQYVWVEVPRTADVYPTAGVNVESFTEAQYEAIENDLHTYTSVYRDAPYCPDHTDTWNSNLGYYYDYTETQYNTQKKKMLKSIYKNGGFYVGRYETGINSVIQQNVTPFYEVEPDEALGVSSRFAEGLDGYTSSLMFGVQWDLILKYMETKGATQYELITDSSGWGEYYPQLVSSDECCKQNIYDIAGSVREMTLEFSGDTEYPITLRGGFNDIEGNVAPAADRWAKISDVGLYNGVTNGFRVALYKDEGTGSEVQSVQPYIPSGYTQVAGTDLGTGLVVQDASGNQYVWVEVPQTAETYPTAGLSITTFTNAELKKIANDLNTYTAAYREEGFIDEYYSDDAYGLTNREYNAQKKKMLKSIYKYGGFYVGRYETGIEAGSRTSAEQEITQTPVIKQNVYPYTWTTPSQAQTLASSFGANGYTSSMLFGVQWDLVLKYLETKGTTQAEIITNSSGWGNYRGSTFTITNENAKYTKDNGVTWKSATSYSKANGSAAYLTTGASEQFARQNIYDLAGNFWETTLEYSGDATKPTVARSSDAQGIDDWMRASYQGLDDVTWSQANNSFRVALYTDEEVPIDETSPYLPAGYSYVSGTNLDNGLVIKDGSGNEFVWVEVPRTATVYPTAGTNITSFTSAEYDVIENDLHTYTALYRNGTTFVDEYYNGSPLTSNEYEIQKKKMLKSIYKNGGFYVGRYETGIDYSESHRKESGDATQTPVIKQNAYPYNWVTAAQSQTLASAFATEGYTSSLMFGVQWDLTMKYLETKGATQSELITDSKSWGNYSDNLYNITNASAKYSEDAGNTYSFAPYTKSAGGGNLLTTGSSDTFSKQNISDLAGNMSEWTAEYGDSTDTPCVRRGGNNVNIGAAYPAYNRLAKETTDAQFYTGFRVALYRDEDAGIAVASTALDSSGGNTNQNGGIYLGKYGSGLFENQNISSIVGFILTNTMRIMTIAVGFVLIVRFIKRRIKPKKKLLTA